MIQCIIIIYNYLDDELFPFFFCSGTSATADKFKRVGITKKVFWKHRSKFFLKFSLLRCLV